MVSSQTSTIQQRKRVILECYRSFNLPQNPAYQELLSLDVIPNAPSKKLAILLLTYKRQATASELAKISNQSAALIRELRNDGFEFQGDSRHPYLYKTVKGEVCRRIIGFKKPKPEIRSKAKALVDKSIAACISAIEIYNKPDFRYREETFSILMVNAWELLLKARLVVDGGNSVQAIQVIENKTLKRNRAGNPMTIDITKAINQLSSRNILDIRCTQNIQALIEIRDNAIHYINKTADFALKVRDFGTASLSNYLSAINQWFGKDLAKYNFYLMPISFFHPTDIKSTSILNQDKQIENIMAYLHSMERQYPFDETSSYNISAQIEIKFVRSSVSSSAQEVRFTNNKEAPEITIPEDNPFKTRWLFAELITRLKDRYSDFKQDRRFYSIKSGLEDSKKHGEKFCKIRSLNVFDENKGQKQKYYSPAILAEFDKHYTKK